jgi:hypothetical protein
MRSMALFNDAGGDADGGYSADDAKCNRRADHADNGESDCG